MPPDINDISVQLHRARLVDKVVLFLLCFAIAVLFIAPIVFILVLATGAIE